MYLSYLILFCFLFTDVLPHTKVFCAYLGHEANTGVLACVCVFVWRLWGQAVRHKHPTGQERYVFTEKRECVGQQTRNPIVYSRSYRHVRRGIAVWVMPIENPKELLLLYSIQDRLNTIM